MSLRGERRDRCFIFSMAALRAEATRRTMDPASRPFIIKDTEQNELTSRNDFFPSVIRGIVDGSPCRRRGCSTALAVPGGNGIPAKTWLLCSSSSQPKFMHLSLQLAYGANALL